MARAKRRPSESWEPASSGGFPPWDAAAHLFIGKARTGLTDFDRGHRDRTERAGILAALRGCADDTIVVPTALTGPRTSFHVLSQRPEFPESLRGGKPAVRRFWRHIEALRQKHSVEEISYRRTNRHLSAQLVVTPEGMRQCVE